MPNHKLITNADINLFQRLANSLQSKLLNEYGVAYDSIYPLTLKIEFKTLTLEYCISLKVPALETIPIIQIALVTVNYVAKYHICATLKPQITNIENNNLIATFYNHVLYLLIQTLKL